MLVKCLDCTALFAPDLSKCPHCGSTSFVDQGSTQETFQEATIPELKEELKERGEKVSGTKQELLERLDNA